MACARPSILRKQKSCVTDFATARIRDRRSVFLHKQFSIDETALGHNGSAHNGQAATISSRNETAVNSSNGHSYIAQRSSRQYWPPSPPTKPLQRKPVQAWPSSTNISTCETCPENSLRISTAIKNNSNDIHENNR